MMGPIYLDHNASTPTEPSVVEAVLEAMVDLWANPSSSEHTAGAAAASAVETARKSIAATINCRPKELIFCSGSTEANNLALFGSFPALKSRGKTSHRNYSDRASVHSCMYPTIEDAWGSSHNSTGR